MVKVKAEVSAPFKMCEGCPLMDIEQTDMVSNDGRTYWKYYSCANNSICKNVVERFLENMPVEIDVNGSTLEYSLNIKKVGDCG